MPTASCLNQWQGDFGMNPMSDADNDGDSDGADFLTWQRQLGSVAAAESISAAVPEPNSLRLLAAAFAVAVVMRALRERNGVWKQFHNPTALPA